MNRTRVVLGLMLGGLGLLCWVLPSGTPPATAHDGSPNTAVREVLEREEWFGVYGCCEELVKGGGLYAGRVLSVQVLRTYPDEVHPHFEPWQEGTFRFRVDRTVTGPPRPVELTLRYSSALPYPDGLPRGLRAVTSWDLTPPRSGDRLLLLLLNPKEEAELLKSSGTEVRKVWRGVEPGHPLVLDFEAAGRYLAAPDDATREQLFRRLCTSQFPSIRDFAHCVAFDHAYPTRVFAGDFDPVQKSRLVLEFLRLTVPRMSYEQERQQVTWAFRNWPGANPQGVTEELRAAFVDWYLTELATLDRAAVTGMPQRGSMALQCLEQMLARPEDKERTLALFKQRGRAALEKRLEACAAADNPHIRQNGQRVLKLLRGN